MAANMTTINLNGVPYRMRADMVAAYNEHAADRDPFAKDELRDHPAFDLGFAEGWEKADEKNGTAYDKGVEAGYKDAEEEFDKKLERERNAAYDQGYAEGKVDGLSEARDNSAVYDL